MWINTHKSPKRSLKKIKHNSLLKERRENKEATMKSAEAEESDSGDNVLLFAPV